MRSNLSQKRLKLPHSVIIKSPGLLTMLYKVSELAEELSIPERTLRDWLEMGAPHQRDSRNHIWIPGDEFAIWVKWQKKLNKSRKLGDGEAYCLRCKQSVKLIDPLEKFIIGKLIHIKGTCDRCGCTINRGGRIG